MPDERPDRLRAAYEERVRVLSEAIAQRERELRILSQVAARVHGEDGVQAILDIALDEILSQMELNAAWIFAGHEGDRELKLVAYRGISQAYLEQVRCEGLGECLCREVFWTGHRMQARNTTQCPRMPDIIGGLQGPVAHACIPLRFEAGNRGVLNVAARPGEQFSEEQLRFLETLGHQIGIAVERARHRQSEVEAQARFGQSQRMAALGTFAAGLAHEVRNPLNSMALQLSILERRIARLGEPLAREMTDLASIIREEIQRLEGLVGDFLLFSRSGRLDARPLPLADVVDEVLRLLRPEADAAGVRLARGEGPAPAPVVGVDREKMKQVVINLVRNALEAVPRGGSVTVECAAEGGEARLVVRDDGPGLPSGLRLFEPFVTTKAKGTGLGLSIVQQIVLQHGGDVTAADAPGGGAVFTVTLPLAAPAARTAP